MSIVNVAAYKFVTLAGLPERRRELRRVCHEAGLRGTILLAAEGINLFVAGKRDGVDRLLGFLECDEAIGPLDVKESLTDHQPFNRMLVRIKNEIIAFGVPDIAPAKHPSRKVEPAKLKAWLDEGRDITLLDTRNDYEIELGSFQQAEKMGLDHFREFPEAAEKLPQEWKTRPLIMYCTGGIRCEKAGPLMERLGFEHVYQLDGGILNYFAEVGQEHFQGDCFVFDQRVAVDSALRETDAAQCYACQAILTPAEQQSPMYVKGESCPHCYQTSGEKLEHVIARRHERIRQVSTPLPGGAPYDNYRPMHVGGKLAGLPLLDFLTAVVPPVSRADWEAEVAGGRVLLDREPVGIDRRVELGEKFEHWFPDRVEPPVNAAIRVLYEDAALVVIDKPAPLPMHPGGRFNKNTLAEILAPVYYPERLRHAHRLDANTTGVVLMARTQRIASRLQPQFARGEVTKLYRARVHGRPSEQTFRCDLPIAGEASAAGTRRTTGDGQAALTEFRMLKQFEDGTSLLEARPITGRTNQIRLHLWSLGLPIVGDATYLAGGEIANHQSLAPDDPPMCLHAWKIGCRHPATEEWVEFEAPLPEWAED